MLIGMDILKHATINFDKKELTFSPKTIPRRGVHDTSGTVTLKIPSTRIDWEGSKATDDVTEEATAYISEAVTLEPQSVIIRRVRLNKQVIDGSEIMLERNDITATIATARVLSRMVHNGIVVNIVNMGEKTETLPPGTKLGRVKYIKNNKVVKTPTNIINNITEKMVSTMKKLDKMDIVCKNKQYEDNV